ncbi:hypothetical protein MMAG44476_05636 [Mycolicibacterium mageritense DSM 44476 = CIP 104973]|uniref:Uncharacterized protein n=1 Tax=Mycolicibacterium mageritense TaxID=53462 RepID=A0AAI8U270_MYCME|nr:hypothetical protein hbim_06782 [Mycolicibacterium mageritense]CDO27089.1 hypothetical protein BN978_07654 [Mycolicibacterium mageritense DSM 44476 = CIP 104973]
MNLAPSGVVYPTSDDQKNGVTTVNMSRTFDTRTARIALLLIRRPIKSRRYPENEERLVTPEEAALLDR